MISNELYNQLETLIQAKDMGLYDVEFLRENDSLLLRISLFKQGGVSLEDCELISSLISPVLDVELENMESYFLEVSSPGLERVLKKPAHFLYSIGDIIEVRLMDKTVIRGILMNYQHEIIEIQITQENLPRKKIKSSGVVDSKKNLSIQAQDSLVQIEHIALKDCKKVKTLFDWDSAFRQS
ncbi:ribosome maturation factor RimP [Helicobacter didelphidarum]|uniref:Ribosome maturation factor RimP n=1 Tax=Helicobacter didelphidarum TaxID=2040648 RepID=A0A3D8IQA4_9HELI|nr:ribosome maturation factor RimP [Helicobacter didelphidarum]RDU67086.1 ribosome maturation factor RimP [Helicobacter didelphidarum]